MAEKRVSVRLVATGADGFRAELRNIGEEGVRALGLIEAAARGAAAGMQATGAATTEAARQLEEIARRSVNAARTLRDLGGSADPLVASIERLTGVSGRVARSADDIEAYGRELDDLRAQFNPVFAAQQRYEQGLEAIRQAHRVGAISADEMTEAISRQGRQLEWTLAQLRTADTVMGEVGRSTQFVGHRMANLSFQLQDIGVSLAGGMNPFLVMAQQGSQIAQIYGFGGGGVGGLMRDLRGMVEGVARALAALPMRFPMVTAAVAALGLGLAGVRSEMRGIGVEGAGFLETARASVEVLAARVMTVLRPAIELIRPVVESIAGWFRETMVAVWEAVKAGINGVINAFRIGYQAVLLAWEGLPDAIGGFVVGAANATVRGINMLMERVTFIINRTIDGLNDRLSRLADFAGMDFTPFGRMEAPSVAEFENPFADRTDERVAAFLERLAEIRASDPVGGFLADVRDRILENRAALEQVEDAAGGAGRALEAAAQQAATGWAAVAEALRSYATEALDWGTGLGESLVGAFRSAEEAFVQFARTGKLDFRALIQSILVDIARLEFRRLVLGPLANLIAGVIGGGAPAAAAAVPSFAGGGFTGMAPRSGGLDGQGGFLAMLHPREQVIDLTRSGGGRGGSDSMHVHVTVGVDDSGALWAQVDRRISAGMAGAVAAVEDRLPRRVRQIMNDPRRI